VVVNPVVVTGGQGIRESKNKIAALALVAFTVVH
jgi:hypothetical protein